MAAHFYGRFDERDSRIATPAPRQNPDRGAAESYQAAPGWQSQPRLRYNHARKPEPGRGWGGGREAS